MKVLLQAKSSEYLMNTKKERFESRGENKETHGTFTVNPIRRF
jgi:hypothetical protein